MKLSDAQKRALSKLTNNAKRTRDFLQVYNIQWRTLKSLRNRGLVKIDIIDGISECRLAQKEPNA